MQKLCFFFKDVFKYKQIDLFMYVFRIDNVGAQCSIVGYINVFEVFDISVLHYEEYHS